MIQHRELEQKLADAKLEQASAILMEEKGKNQKEKELVMSSLCKKYLASRHKSYVLEGAHWPNG